MPTTPEPVHLQPGQIIRLNGSYGSIKDIFRSETSTGIVLEISTTARSLIDPYRYDLVLLNEFETSQIELGTLEDMQQEIKAYLNAYSNRQSEHPGPDLKNNGE